MNKLFFIISFIFILFSQQAFAQTNEEFLNYSEAKLFSTKYQNESVQKRLNRLEKNLYGTAKNNLSVEQRINNLKKLPVFSIAAPVKKTAIKTQNSTKTVKTSSYPMIDKMEQKVLLKTFKTDDIYNRLSRLEQALYKRTFPENTLSARTDNLCSTVFKTTPKIKEDVDEKSLNPLISELETSILKTTYPNENSYQRIQRLEKTIYNQTYDDDELYTRMERLVSVSEGLNPTASNSIQQTNLYGVNYTNSPQQQTLNSSDILPTLFLLLLGLCI
jgi:hypothetical protein